MGSLLQLEAGTVFGGDFRIVSMLERGGMGAVYVVEQLSTNKRRALKLMLATRASDPALRKRFEQEARVGALIPSEHVVDVIAAGVDAESQIPWLAMELLEGEDLSKFITRRGFVGPAETYEIFSQLCHALAAAHAIPVVHRDLKPGNIFLARPRLAEARFVVKVLDFGIAKIVGDTPSTTAAVGTPLWMAPEQTKSRATVRPSADVWALGLIAFYLLTGKLYWESANDPDAQAMTVMREVLFDSIVPASERARAFGVAERLPAGFDAWFARCVVRDVEDRLATATEAWAALAEVLGPGRLARTASFPDIASGPTALAMMGAARTPHPDALASTMLSLPPAAAKPTTSPHAMSVAAGMGTTLGSSELAPRTDAPRARPLRWVIGAGVVVVALLVGAGVMWMRATPLPATSTASSAPSSPASGTKAEGAASVAGALASGSSSAAPSAAPATTTVASATAATATGAPPRPPPGATHITPRAAPSSATVPPSPTPPQPPKSAPTSSTPFLL